MIASLLPSAAQGTRASILGPVYMGTRQKWTFATTTLNVSVDAVWEASVITSLNATHSARQTQTVSVKQ